MNQSRLESVVESCVNTASGFVLAFALWQWVVAPMFGYSVTLTDNFWMTSIFTAASVARGYVWRRFFNAGLHRVVQQFIRRLHV